MIRDVRADAPGRRRSLDRAPLATRRDLLRTQAELIRVRERVERLEALLDLEQPAEHAD